MLSVKIDADGILVVKEKFKRVKPSFVDALYSEAARLRRLCADYARNTQFGPYAPLTTATRARGLYTEWGKLMAGVQRYGINEETLMARIGVLSPQDADVLNMSSKDGKAVRTASKKLAGFAILAARQRSTTITRKQQAAIAGKLRKYGRRSGGYSRFGGMGSFIPKLGTHTIRARPVVEVVLQRERNNIVRNLSGYLVKQMQMGTETLIGR